jgi:hypothetical protein
MSRSRFVMGGGDFLYVTRNTYTFQTQECQQYNVSRRDKSHYNSNGLWSRMLGTSCVFLEIYRQFKMANVGMLVMQEAEWFTTAILVVEHASGSHFVGPMSRTANHLVHCEQARRPPFVATMTTGRPCRACPPPQGSSS